jgi:hypothetical protein
MRADLVVIDSDPRENLSVLRRPFALATNGYFLTRDDLDALLAERAEAAKAFPEVEERHLQHGERHRHFKQTTYGATMGKICCNVIPRGEDLVVEEESSTLQSSSRRTIVLGPQRHLVRFEEQVTGRAGQGSLVVERDGDGYRAERRDLDGAVVASRLDTPPLFPSDDFGFAALSEVVADLQDGEVTTLALISDELVAMPARVSASPDGVRMEWLREGWPTTQTFLVQDGAVVGAKDDDPRSQVEFLEERFEEGT